MTDNNVMLEITIVVKRSGVITFRAQRSPEVVANAADIMAIGALNMVANDIQKGRTVEDGERE